MSSSIFGTDGVRGRVNTYPMSPEAILRIAQEVGLRIDRRNGKPRVLIGTDTRSSGCMVEGALVAGFTSVGADVELADALPTPAIAMLTRTMRMDLGVMISASHNPYDYNGIKFFGPDGYKLSDAQEASVTASVEGGRELGGALATPAETGCSKRIDGAAERYMQFAVGSVPKNLRIDGLRIVVDAANGAAYRTAPGVLEMLGAEVIRIGTSPNGLNINDGCGSTSPSVCREAVLKHEADLGIALDGDADRLHLIDEKGRIIDGDQLMALIAEREMSRGNLRRATLVATVMSNIGLDRHLAGHGIAVERTNVGDRHVVERMRELGCSVGGEQSGHIILSDFATTGDGLIAALQVLAAIAETGRPASETLSRFCPLPQVHRVVKTGKGRSPMQSAVVQDAIMQGRSRLGAGGRILVRPSGTEPVIRVMAEGEDLSLLEQIASDICNALATVVSQQSVHSLWEEEVIATSLPNEIGEASHRRAWNTLNGGQAFLA